ncbi:MAG: HAD family hydrolase, partial [Halodesulfurarchaeum sp.]
REQAFTALDLYTKYDRMVDVMVADVDETLRSAGGTDNEIPRETLHQLTELHEAGLPIVVCTGQTLENVKGFTIQGLGNELVHSGRLSIVYEGGSGVFTPGHGTETKQLLYEDLDASIVDRFQTVRSSVMQRVPDGLRSRIHLQGNEFNVTVKPNEETGSDRAAETIRRALPHLLRQLGRTLPSDDGYEHACEYYARADPEIAVALEAAGESPRAAGERPKAIGESQSETDTNEPDDIPEAVTDVLDQIDVAYYEADAVEMTSRELNKVVGVRAAFEVLGIEDPFGVVLGDSKSDLRVMRWFEEEDIGIAAAPEHASSQVVEHVRERDDLVYPRGAADQILRMVRAMGEFEGMDGL